MELERKVKMNAMRELKSILVFFVNFAAAICESFVLVFLSAAESHYAD